MALRHRRTRKLPRDNIRGVTKPTIRRLARRGGVKRITADVYDAVRATITLRLKSILELLVDVLETTDRKTVTVADVVFVLNRMGFTIYGFGEARRGRYE